MITTFKDFIANLIIENLAPSLQKIIQEPNKSAGAKQYRIAKEIRRLAGSSEEMKHEMLKANIITIEQLKEVWFTPKNI